MRNRDFDIRNVHDKLQKVLGEDFFSEITKFIPQKGPNIDVFETEVHVFVVVEQPGLSRDDKQISIRLDGYRLLIEGEIPYSYPVKELIQSERFIGKFKREIDLPYSIQPKGIRAAYKRGLVVITIPKKEDGEGENVQIDFEED